MPRTDVPILSSRAGSRTRSVLLAAFTLSASGCVLTATRPAQEYSDTAAALRAAKEVGADTLASELYQQADESFANAKNQYRLKYYFEAREGLLKARQFAEKAEFEALRAGATRVSTAPKDPMGEPPPPKEGFSPPSNSKYVETAEQEANRPPPTPTPSPTPTPTPVILQLPTAPR